MREFKKHRSRRAELLNFSVRLVGALILFFLTAAAVKGAWDMYGRLSMASVGQQEAAAELKDLQVQQVRVSTQVQELSSPRGQEALLREHYGVVRPGEGVVQIVQESTTTETTGRHGSWLGVLFHTLFSW